MPLLEIDRPWLVTKDYRHGECVLEYAICEGCRDEVTARIPEETKARVRHHLETTIDWSRRLGELLASHDRLARCIACEAPRHGSGSYSLSAAFDASGRLIEGPLPLLMCEACAARMKSLLCETGLRVWNDFVESHLHLSDGDGWTGIW